MRHPTKHARLLPSCSILATALLAICFTADAFTHHYPVRSTPVGIRISGNTKTSNPFLIPSRSRISYAPNYLRTSSLIVKASEEDISNPETEVAENSDDELNGQNIITVISLQSLLVVLAVVAAAVLHTPNYGLGASFALNTDSLITGVLYTIPLILLAAFLDLFEDRFPALKNVTLATQRSVLQILGGEFKPLMALSSAVGLGLVAGVGEEMLFRGVMQAELTSRCGEYVALGVTSVIFGLLHCVTPVYAILAGVASLFFGVLYINYNNLAVAIVCHGVYDVVALLWAHYTVTEMTKEEQQNLLRVDEGSQTL